MRYVVTLAVLSLLAPAAWNLGVSEYLHVRNPTPGKTYDIEGRKMHIHCTGSGSYTVVIEGGASADSLGWRGIQETLSRTTRVCTYDRNGHGWSEPSSGPHDANTIARKLNALLDKAGVPRPLVLAGHSAGGLYIRAYAHHFPKEMAGAVMIDASSPAQIDELPDWRANWESDKQKLPARVWSERLRVWSGWDRLTGNCRDVPPKELQFLAGEYEAEACRPAYVGEEDCELPYFEDSFKQAARLVTFGDIPLVVITRDTQSRRQQADTIWDREQEQLKTLSSRSWRVIARGAGHGVHHSRPDVVTSEMNRLITYLRGGPAPQWGTTTIR